MFQWKPLYSAEPFENIISFQMATISILPKEYPISHYPEFMSIETSGKFLNLPTKLYCKSA